MAGVIANTGCCNQADLLPLITLFTFMTTHRGPTARESNHSFTSLTHPSRCAPLFPSTGYCDVQGRPSQEISLHTGKSHHTLLHSTCSHRGGFKLVDSQLEKPKVFVALILLTDQNLPPLTRCECLLCRFTLS